MTPIQIDFNLATDGQVGPSGLSRAELESLAARGREAHREIQAARKAKTLAFMDLPFDRAAAAAASALGKEMAGLENLLVLGIGGSSLGGKALFTALCHPFHNLMPRGSARSGARLFFPDNPDPSTFSGLLEAIDLSKTGVAAITKSGGTAETWAQLLVLRERLKALGIDPKDRIVAITDPAKGALRKVATEQGWRTLPVPPAVGGRFSVFTAVGLMPAAAAGIDVGGLLEGAGEMARRCEEPDLFKNPAYLLASVMHLMDVRKGRHVHVFMPYADALRETADWFAQLWAESLGKKNAAGGSVGATPLRAVGATDQHSLLQLLMEGPQDKLTVFVTVEKPRTELTIPHGFTQEPDVSYLGGHWFHELLNIEQRATAAALAANGRPSVTIRLPELSPASVGGLMMLLEVATAFAGSLYEIDAFNQPGVEAGKRYACGLLGRPGYEDSKQELDRRPPAKSEWVLS